MSVRPRQPYESCEYCYLERVSLRDKNAPAPSNLTLDCSCGPETLCLSKWCKWGKSYGDGKKSPGEIYQARQRESKLMETGKR